MTLTNLIRVMPAEGRMTELCDRITISLNGGQHHVAPGQDVAALLADLGLDTRKVAVERNQAIVPRSLYAHTSLAAGDQLEIVHFIGGG